MKMEYLTRENGPAAFGTRLGIQGVAHVYEKQEHICDTIFQLFIDNGIGNVDGLWGVGAVFQPRHLDGTLADHGTLLLFGDVTKLPFPSFEAALAFCAALGRDIYDRKITPGYLDDLALRRGMQGVQWVNPVVAAAAEAIAAGPQEGEQDDNDGSDCDLRVEVPAARVLH
jgi:hypothetical protein